MRAFRNIAVAFGLTFLVLQCYTNYFPKRYRHLVDLIGNHDGRASIAEKQEFMEMVQANWPKGKQNFYGPHELYIPFVIGKIDGTARAYILVKGQQMNSVYSGQAALGDMEFRIYQNDKVIDPEGRVGLVAVSVKNAFATSDQVYARYIKPARYYTLTESGLKEQSRLDDIKRQLEIFFGPIKNEKP